MAKRVSGRALREAALSPLATEPVPVSALAGNDQPREFIGTKDFDGGYLIFRKLPRSISAAVGGRRMPRRLHRSLESAKLEAARLTEQWPDSTFVIMQEVATVKVRLTGAS